MFPARTAPRMVLTARTAAELMKANPVSIRADASVREALEVLTDRGFGAAPVIDEAGRPVGVLSRSDILVHDREQVKHLPLEEAPHMELPHRKMREGFSVEVVGTSWSNAITMSDPSSRWISIDRSGESMCRVPSRWLLKLTPSSVTLVSSLRLITW